MNAKKAINTLSNWHIMADRNPLLDPRLYYFQYCISGEVILVRKIIDNLIVGYRQYPERSLDELRKRVLQDFYSFK